MASLVGAAVGVVVGCLVGMFPLLFLPDADVMEAVKRKEKVCEEIWRSLPLTKYTSCVYVRADRS